jgi:2-succinyl-5-enolpyruvyl-6-hydroxy-3-cyclohexene-1-carboxylate synthase
MTPTTDMYTLLRAFVDELARCGLQAACTSPGSRSAPLALTLANERQLRCYSHIDERCAGFFALGLAKASELPVAVACTSGTAAAELLPAVIEAREARVPLLVLTADRPAELRDNGAGQAIDQLKLFGAAAKWFVEVSVHEARDEQLRWMRTLACRAYWTALEGRPGAVHLNFPLREPLVEEIPLAEDRSGHEGGAPRVRRRPPMPASPADSRDLRDLVTQARRGIVVAGRHERSTGLGAAAASFAETLGWPLLADPMSGARRGRAAVAHYDPLLRDPEWTTVLSPDLVVRVGDLPVSKPLRGWLAGLPDVRQVSLDPEGAWQDPACVVSDSLALEPAAALEELAAAIADSAATEDDWISSWLSADERAAEAIDGVIGGAGDLSEPRVAAELGVLLPAEATLFVASSMPVRDIETFWPVRPDPPRVLCNRGANGIDGTVSSAFGVAADGTGQVVLLIGDVALAYDIGGLLASTRLGLKLTIVLIDNGGGGIFDFLPVAGASMARAPHPPAGSSAFARAADPLGADGDIYTRHIATPTGLDFAKAAALYELEHEPVATTVELREALERALSPDVGSTLIHVRTDRARNVELHRRVWDAVSEALSP